MEAVVASNTPLASKVDKYQHADSWQSVAIAIWHLCWETVTPLLQKEEHSC